MKTTASQFKRLLPALQHLATFPNCKRGVICERHKLPLAEVEAAIEDLRGPFRVLDIERLTDVAAELGVDLQPFNPEKPLPIVAPLPEKTVLVPKPAISPGRDNIPRRLHEDRVAIAERRANPVVRRSDPEAPAVAGLPPKFIKACQLLLADEDLSENEAAKRAGCSSWSYHKKIRLGNGPIDRIKIRTLLAGGRVDAAQVKPQRRRRSVATAAPASAGALAIRKRGALVRLQPSAEKKVAVPAPNALSELLCAQLFGANTTHVVGLFRLELDVRMVPVPQ